VPHSLRERKKARTRRALQDQALRLFVDKGFEATTIEEIAAAADVSPRTFFRYFASKEAVLLEDEYDPLLFEAIAKVGHTDTPPATLLREVLAELMPPIWEADAEGLFLRTKLMLATPSLAGQIAGQRTAMERVIGELLARVYRRDAGELPVRVTASALVGAMWAAIEAWYESDGAKPLPGLIDGALATVEDAFPLNRPRVRRIRLQADP
jgi:AcrR family transcriptional regulator